jgi:hypothetical protein
VISVPPETIVEGWNAVVDGPNKVYLLVHPEGSVLTEWEPTEDDIHKLLCGGRVRILYTLYRLHPLRVEVLAPVDATEES